MTTETERDTRERVSRLEGAYEQVNERLGDLGRSIDSLWSSIDSLRAEMNGRFDQADRKVTGLYVLVIAGFFGIIATIIGVSLAG